jgi:transposase
MDFVDEAHVRQAAEQLRHAEERGNSQIELMPFRAVRNALILKGYTEGYTLEEVGEPFGLTRERARQLIKKLAGPRRVSRLPTRYRRSEKARVAARERGLRQRKSGERQRNPERNSEIERLVGTGLSYAQVARLIGVIRNVVCTVMYRANHRDDEIGQPQAALASDHSQRAA